MLSNLWNQITLAESDSSDEEKTFPTKTGLLQEDDITAASLLTSFPTYGSHRKTLALESPTVNALNGPTSVSSIVSGDWDRSPSTGTGRRKKVADGLGAVGGLFTFDDLVSNGDDADDNRSTVSAPVSGFLERKKSAGTVGENQADVDPWSDEESNLWRDSKKTRRKRSKKSRSTKKEQGVTLSNTDDLKRQWIHGASLTSNPSSLGSPAAIAKDLSKRPYRKHHFPHNDDATDYTSSDDDHSTVEKVDENSNSWKVDEKFQSHWMPDQLCKTCYGCETQFNMFRRRHHCRLCGQVFCNPCSSFFVEITVGRTNNQEQQHPDVKTVRTCKMCYEQVSASDHNSDTTGQENKQKTLPGNDIQGKEHLAGNIRSISQIQDGGPQAEVDSFQGGSSSNFFNLAQKLEEERIKRESDETQVAADETPTKVRSPRKNISSTFSGRFGRLAESAAREAQLGDAGYNDEETKLIGTGVRNIGEFEDYAAGLSPNLQSAKGITAGMALPPKDDPSLISSVNNQKQYAEAIKEANRHMRMTAADYLEKMGRELMRTDAPTLLAELDMNEGYGPTFDKWVSKLMTLSTKCCKSVKVEIRNGDGLDIRPYCKVKGNAAPMCINPLHLFATSSPTFALALFQQQSRAES